jgi:hypothetical protein
VIPLMMQGDLSREREPIQVGERIRRPSRTGRLFRPAQVYSVMARDLSGDRSRAFP